MIELTILPTGTLQATGVPFVRTDDRVEWVNATFSSCCYLIRHLSGLLLWDTGLPDHLAVQRQRILPPSWQPIINQPLRSALRGAGCRLSDITYLGFSHLHVDHAGNANNFPQSIVLINQKEFEMAFSANPPVAYQRGFYTGLVNNRSIQLTDDYDIFGDQSVIILQTPGHSPGHQSLLVNLPGTGTVILVGDLYYSQTDRTTHRMPAWNNDYGATLHSMERVEQIATKTHATLILGHDATQTKTLPPLLT